jgi:hypothetical protein
MAFINGEEAVAALRRKAQHLRDQANRCDEAAGMILIGRVSGSRYNRLCSTCGLPTGSSSYRCPACQREKDAGRAPEQAARRRGTPRSRETESSSRRSSSPHPSSAQVRR